MLDLVIDALFSHHRPRPCLEFESRLREVVQRWGPDSRRLATLFRELQLTGRLAPECDVEDLADLAARLLELAGRANPGPAPRRITTAITELMFRGLLN